MQVSEQGNISIDLKGNENKAPAQPGQPTNEVKKSEKRKQRFTVDMIPVPDSYRLSPGDSLVVEGGMYEIKHFGE